MFLKKIHVYKVSLELSFTVLMFVLKNHKILNIKLNCFMIKICISMTFCFKLSQVSKASYHPSTHSFHSNTHENDMKIVQLIHFQE